jgi:hypothetical protein
MHPCGKAQCAVMPSPGLCGAVAKYICGLCNYALSVMAASRLHYGLYQVTLSGLHMPLVLLT